MPTVDSNDKNATTSNIPRNENESFDLGTTQVRFVATFALAGFFAFFLSFANNRAYREPTAPRATLSKIENERANAASSLTEVVAALAPTERARPIVETSVKTASEPNDRASDETLVFLVDLNTASKSELLNLPRIGDQLADKIVEYRDANGGFRSVDELLEIKGIGEKTLARLRPLCVVEPPLKQETPSNKTDAPPK